MNLAVVGSGQWGVNLIRNFASLGVLSAVCDRSSEALDRLDQVVSDDVLRTADEEEIWSNPSIDAVVIATPAASHFSNVISALNSNKDVFVEKPLSLDLDQGRELVGLAESKQLVLMVGHILEYHPAVVKLRELVGAGELGELRYIYSNRLNLGRVRTEENILWSFAPHDLSVISTIVDSEPLEVQSFAGTFLQPGIPDVTVTGISFGNGVRAHVFVSWLHPFKEQKLVIVGDKKMAVFDDAADGAKLRLYDKGIDWTGGAPVPRTAAESTLAFDRTEPLLLECQHFCACARDRSTPFTDGKNGLRVLQLLQASQESLDAGGAPVKVTQL